MKLFKLIWHFNAHFFKNLNTCTLLLREMRKGWKVGSIKTYYLDGINVLFKFILWGISQLKAFNVTCNCLPQKFKLIFVRILNIQEWFFKSHLVFSFKNKLKSHGGLQKKLVAPMSFNDCLQHPIWWQFLWNPFVS